jgi:hypothetical protein
MASMTTALLRSSEQWGSPGGLWAGVSQKDTPSASLGISPVPPLIPAFDIMPLHQCARSVPGRSSSSSPFPPEA